MNMGALHRDVSMNMGALHRDVSIYHMYEDACLTYRQPYVYGR